MDPAIIAAIVAGALAAVAVLSGLRVIREHERALVLRLGRRGPLLAPGLRLVLPLGIDRLTRVDLRSAAVRLPQHEVITADGVPLRVTASMHQQVVNPVLAASRVVDHMASSTELAQAAIRDVASRTSLRTFLTEPAAVAEALGRFVDERAQPWGVAITAIDLIEVELPEVMRRAMAEESRRLYERRAVAVAEPPSAAELEAAQRLLDAFIELEGRAGDRPAPRPADADDQTAGPFSGQAGG